MKKNRLTTTSVAALILLAVPFGLTACSGTPDDRSTSAASDGLGTRFGSCLRDAGVDIPDPTDDQVREGVFQSPPDVDEATFERATRTCAEQLGVRSGASDADKQKWERQYDQVASCIRDRGYEDFPEQEPGSLQFNDYPRASEPGFEDVSMDCLREYAPDTQVQGN